jgi:hypothetical protein
MQMIGATGLDRKSGERSGEICGFSGPILKKIFLYSEAAVLSAVLTQTL